MAESRWHDNDPGYALLSEYASGEELDQWLGSLSEADAVQTFQNWTRREEVNFIRSLRDCEAFDAIKSFIHRYNGNSSFVFTTAIYCLSTSEKHQNSALNIFERMEERGVKPSPYTFSALFQSVSRTDTMRLKDRLEVSYPGVRWTLPVWEAAVYSCSRGSGSGWAEAEILVNQMEHKGLPMTPRLYLALFQVCNAANDVPHTMEVLDRIREVDHHVEMDERLWGASLQVCASAGEPGVAMLVLEIMQEEGYVINVLHCTAYLKALSTVGYDRKAIQFLDSMAGLEESPGSGNEKHDTRHLTLPHPDRVAVQTAIGACANARNFAGAREILDRLKLREYGDHIRISTFDYNTALTACQDSHTAKEIIREMRLSRRHRSGVAPPNRLSYTRALSVCKLVADVETARFLLKNIIHDGITPDVHMYNTLIWTCTAAGDISGAYATLADMEKKNFAPTSVSFNGIIAALAAARKSRESLDVFRRMKILGIPGTSSTFKYLAKSLRGLREQEEKLSALEQVFLLMTTLEKRSGVGGPIVASLINTYGSLNRYDDAKRTFYAIRGTTDLSCLRAMLFACSQACPPKWQDALFLLHTSDIMDEVSLVDSGALSNAMMSCSKADQWEESLNLWRLYGDKNTSILSLNSLVAACGRSGRPDVAIEVLNEMELRGIDLDRRSFRNAMIACSRADPGDDEGGFEWWECSLSLLRRMEKLELVPDAQTYSAAIATLERKGKWQHALSVLQAVIDHDTHSGTSKLNAYCFNAAISACEKGGAWVEALDIYEQMKEYGNSLRPTFVTIACLINALDRAGQKELAQDVYQEAVEAGTVQLWRSTFDKEGKRLNAMDLHAYSGALARTAVRCHIEALLSRQKRVSEDWVIIVGKGLRSVDRPVLFPTVFRLLRNAHGLNVDVDPSNHGRLIVSKAELLRFVEEKSWC